MRFDLIIHGGQVVDGSGQPAFAADVAVASDRIAAVGSLPSATAARRIDASGLIIAPGFIDPHVHSEIGLLAGRCGGAVVQQGVTTHLLAPDGFGYAPLSPPKLRQMRAHLASFYGEPDLAWDWSSLDEYLAGFAGRAPVNVVPQVSHHAVRLEVMGWADRAPTAAELEQMKTLTREGLDAGAVAFATGLDYLPAAHCDTDELLVLCRVVAERGGIYTAHQRHGDGGVLAATRETLRLAAETGIAVHISHLYGDAQLFALIDDARANGLDVTFDSYPYTAGATSLLFYLPRWAQTGEPAEVLARLKDPEARRRLLPALIEKLRSPAQWDTYLISGVGAGRNRELQGRSFAKIAGDDPRALTDFICDLLIEENLAVLLIDGWLDDEQVERSLLHPAQMVMSDGIFLSYPHPRGFGTFPRVLGHYVRERGLLSLETAIHKMTGFPANRFQLRDRGLIQVGRAADVTIFDPARVRDCATYVAPELPPEGIRFVIVNGQLVVDAGRVTNATPGRVLKPLLERAPCNSV